MPPCLSSKLALQPKGINMPSLCCDHFGLGMPKSLPLESHRSPLAGKPDKTALLFGRVADLAMCWVKGWFHLWQSFSGALGRALLMGIAKGAGRLAASNPLKKGRRPLGGKEEHGRQKSKLDDGEKLRCKADNRRHLTPRSLKRWSQKDGESSVEDGPFGGCPEEYFYSANMDTMALKDNPTLCLLHHSASFDFESASESSSDEDKGLGDTARPGRFPQNSLDSLGMGEDSEDSCSSPEDSGDFENNLKGDSRESVESPSVSQGCKGSVERSSHSVMLENRSVESMSDSSEDGEYLSQYAKAKENLGSLPTPFNFQSPLVLSLFYSPSEEEDSEGWTSEDEVEETAQLYLDGSLSGNGDSSAAAEENSQHQDPLENFCGPCFPSADPSCSFCISKSIQPATFAPPEPKKHNEITTSFLLRRPGSTLEELCINPPNPFPSKDQSSATGPPPHQCCPMETGRNCDLVTMETSLGSQKESQRVKKVQFSPEVTVHMLVVWDYASRAARRGPWEEMARDRCRFQRRIAEVGAILEPCLEMEHRAKAWRKVHRALAGPCSAGENS